MDHLTIEQGADGFRAHGRLLNLPWFRTMPSYEELQEVIINELRLHAVKIGKIFTIQLNDINGESYWLNAAPNGQIDPQPITNEDKVVSPASTSQHVVQAENPPRPDQQHTSATPSDAAEVSPSNEAPQPPTAPELSSDIALPAPGTGQPEAAQHVSPSNDEEQQQAPATPPAQDAGEQRHHQQTTNRPGEHAEQEASHAEQASGDPEQVDAHHEGPEQAGSHPEHAESDPQQAGSRPEQPKQAESHPERAENYPQQTSEQLERPEQLQSHPGHAGSHSQQPSSHPGQAGSHPGQAGSHPGQAGNRPEHAGNQPQQTSKQLELPEQAGNSPEHVGNQPQQARNYPEHAENQPQQASSYPTPGTQATGHTPLVEAQPHPGQAQHPEQQGSPVQQGHPNQQDSGAQHTANPARRTREDLIQGQPQAPEPPASQGWRGFLRRASRSRINIAPSRTERAHREAVASVQRSLSGPKTIVVVNPKGGAHKTTATLMIAATFGMHRGGSTLAWDNNETQGTLGARSLRAHHTNTAVELLKDLDRFNHVHSARFGDLDNYVRSQGDARFDVLASDDDPSSPTIMSGNDFLAIHSALSRFYRVMVIDTGNNPRASNWQAAVEVADQLVIVSTLRDDTATVAAGLADRLHSHGFEEKLAQSVTVLSEPGEKSDRELTNRLQEHFAQVTRSVTIVPYEPAFIGGGILNLATLRPATLDAWLRASAQIAEGLNG